MIRIEDNLIYSVAAIATALLGAASDLKDRRIPNLLTGPALLTGLLLHLALDGPRGLFTAFSSAVICGAVFLVFYLAGGMGAGDVKLIAAVGAMTGLPATLSLLAFTAIAGGVLALALAAYRGRLRQTFGNVAALTMHHAHSGLTPHPQLNVRNAGTLRLPYGVAIALGCCATFYLNGLQR